MRGRKTVNYQDLTCRAGQNPPGPTPTKTTTKLTTTKGPTLPPRDPAENGDSGNGELSQSLENSENQRISIFG